MVSGLRKFFFRFENRKEYCVETFVNQLFEGDCITGMKALPDECVDLVVTDPPYIVNYTERSGRKIANDDNADWVLPAFQEVGRVLKQGSFCVSFYGWSKVDVFLSAWKKSGLRPVGHFVWVKPYSSRVGYTKAHHECAYLLAKGLPNRKLNPPVDVLGWENTANKLHPTQKPVCALVPLIEAFSNSGDVILDPFAGSGSTGVAARQCGRRFILFEKDPNFFSVAKKRLAPK